MALWEGAARTGIESHILFKGAPIWPTAPLICEAAPLVRLLHHRLSSAPLFRPIKILFVKYKNFCCFILLCCNNLICICYIGENKENNNTQKKGIFYLFTDLFLLFFCHHGGISSCPCVFLPHPGALCRHTLRWSPALLAETRLVCTGVLCSFAGGAHFLVCGHWVQAAVHQHESL